MTHSNWRPKSMIFAPNCTGPLDLGSAVILWLSAREALERKLNLYIRFDDWQYTWERFSDRTFQTWESLEAYYQTISSTQRACEILGIHPTAMYRWTDRSARYHDAVDRLQKAGLLAEYSWAGNLYIKDVPCPKDAVQGYLPTFQALVLRSYVVNTCLSAVVDAIDFDTPIHIRGRDIAADAVCEAYILRALRSCMPVHRPDLEYAHIPLICDLNGDALHKSELKDKRYLFTEFAKHFFGVESLRKALEKLVLVEGREYALDNILKPRCRGVLVTPEGKRVGVLPPAVGQDKYVKKAIEEYASPRVSTLMRDFFGNPPF